MRSIPVTHRRINGQSEAAAVSVSDLAGDRFGVISDSYGMWVQVRQLAPSDPIPGDIPATAGVVPVPSGKMRIAVSLEHRRGTYKAVSCYNEDGDHSPQATLQKLLETFSTEDLVSWVKANA